MRLTVTDEDERHCGTRFSGFGWSMLRELTLVRDAALTDIASAQTDVQTSKIFSFSGKTESFIGRETSKRIPRGRATRVSIRTLKEIIIIDREWSFASTHDPVWKGILSRRRDCFIMMIFGVLGQQAKSLPVFVIYRVVHEVAYRRDTF